MSNSYNGKLKAVTFSYDDGVTQDQRLIRILDKYGLKCTFQLNSGNFGKAGALVRSMARKNVTVAHVKPRINEIADIYKGHEVAVHTLTHPNLSALPEEEIIRQVEEDRIALSEIVGYAVRGMAYPGGSPCVNDNVVRIIREKTGVRYARVTDCTYDFRPCTNLLEFKPTVYHMEWDRMFELAEKFVSLEPEQKQLFFIWGHSYEFDIDDTWDRFEDFCRIISRRNDIFYGTNSEVLL